MTDEEKKEKNLLEPQATDVVVGEENNNNDVLDQARHDEARQRLDELYSLAKKDNAEEQKNEKLARVHEAVASIGDMGRSLANLYHVTQYSPNAFADSGLSDKSRARAEMAKEKMKANRAAMMRYLQEMDRLDENQRSMKFKMAQAKAALEEKRRHNEETEKLQQQAAEEKQANDAKRLNIQQQNADTARARVNKSGNGGNGGGGGNNYTYVGFADGSGVNINKNDEKAIGAMYNRLPDDAKLMKKNKYGIDEIDNNPATDKALRAVRAYLASHKDEGIEGYAKQVSQRSQQPKSAGSLLPNKKGKSKGSLLPKTKK